jgi:multiple sugar transport system permease protein/putative aldouronate transport system permease protein
MGINTPVLNRKEFGMLLGSRLRSGSQLLTQIRRKWQLYVFLALPLIWLLIFRYYPMYGAQIAFRDFLPGQTIWDSPWVGLKNFERFFQSPIFTTLLFNTLGLSLYSIVVAFPFPILLALSLNQVRMQIFKQSVQMITYAPNFISTVVMVGIILQFLDVRTGPINLLLQALGLPTINFMGDADLFPSIYVWTGIWQFAGFESIIYIAALTGIDPALHEAAVVDGASRLQRIWHIDIPGILPVVVVMLILKMGQVLSISFEKVFLLQNPLNLSASEIISTYIYKVGIMGGLTNFSFTAAIGLFNSVVGLILVLSAQYISKRLTGSGLW